MGTDAMEMCTINSLPARKRPAALAKLYGARLSPIEITADEPDRFAGEIVVGDLGPLRIGRLRCSRATLARDDAPSGSPHERSYAFLFQLSGSSRLSHYGSAISLEAGDLTLCDNEAPHMLVLGSDAELLVLRVPAALLKDHLPSRECFCGRRLPGQDGVTSTVTAMALSLFDQIEAGLALHYQGRVARHLLDMIATAYAVGFDSFAAASSIVSGRHATVKLYIEQHLRDPDLSPCSIAARLKLSSRYLRMIFATNHETISAYILRRRLEECARQIGDPAWRGHSMTEIAFAWGFNSAPHFTRSFRDRYDTSPRDYRRSRLEEQDSLFRPAAQAA